MLITNVIFFLSLSLLQQCLSSFSCPGNVSSCPSQLPTVPSNTLLLAASSDGHYPSYYTKGITHYEFRAWQSLHTGFTHHILPHSILDFGISPLQKRIIHFIQVQNPTSRPVLVQPFLLLEPNSIEDLLTYDCTNQLSVAEPVLDEDEFDSFPGLGHTRCAMDETEVEAITSASAHLAPSPSLFTGDFSLLEKMKHCFSFADDSLQVTATDRVNWLPRYKCNRECGWVLAEPEHNFAMLLNNTQAFFIAAQGQSLQLLPPHSTRVLGPVVFQPSAIGRHTGTLLLRNNLTVFETMHLFGEAKYSRLAFERQTVFRRLTSHRANAKFYKSQELATLEFNITKEDIIDQLVTSNGVSRLPQRVSFTRMYEAENVGTLPMLIRKILIEGQSCSLMGLSVANCMTPILVQPKDTVSINITYETSFTQSELKVWLWIVTEDNAFYIPVQVLLKLGDISVLSEWMSVDRNSWDYFSSETVMLLHVMIAVGCVLAIAHEAVSKWTEETNRSVVYSSREYLKPLSKVRVEVRYKSPHLSIIVKTDLPPQSHRSETPVPVSIPLETPRSYALKPRKAKKVKSNVMKFAPTVLDTQVSKVSAPADSPPVIVATNKFLACKKKSQHNSSTSQCKTEESDGAGSLRDHTMFESFTTSHTEEELDDVFLDDYKTRKVLLNGFSYSHN